MRLKTFMLITILFALARATTIQEQLQKAKDLSKEGKEKLGKLFDTTVQQASESRTNLQDYLSKKTGKSFSELSILDEDDDDFEEVSRTFLTAEERAEKRRQEGIIERPSFKPRPDARPIDKPVENRYKPVPELTKQEDERHEIQERQMSFVRSFARKQNNLSEEDEEDERYQTDHEEDEEENEEEDSDADEAEIEDDNENWFSKPAVFDQNDNIRRRHHGRDERRGGRRQVFYQEWQHQLGYGILILISVVAGIIQLILMYYGIIYLVQKYREWKAKKADREAEARVESDDKTGTVKIFLSGKNLSGKTVKVFTEQ